MEELCWDAVVPLLVPVQVGRVAPVVRVLVAGVAARVDAVLA